MFGPKKTMLPAAWSVRPPVFTLGTRNYAFLRPVEHPPQAINGAGVRVREPSIGGYGRAGYMNRPAVVLDTITGAGVGVYQPQGYSGLVKNLGTKI